ncbi:hypothetical protein AAG906_030796 [Vitis piasezkii]
MGMNAVMSNWRQKPVILPLFKDEEEMKEAKDAILKLELKTLPPTPVVISSSLTVSQEDNLLRILRKHKKAIGWQISDLKGISPLICTHHIYMEEGAKPTRQPQRRLNPHMQEVVRAEVLKLLQAGIIYPISDSTWVSPTQVVPKKSGITVVKGENGDEVSTRLTTSWRVCIDYRKLNTVTRKDHFSLPFMDQVLERVFGHPFYCFLDGYSGYFQIEIDADSFWIMQRSATFQRCMLSIFNDMVERIMEVFMDDITVYGTSFEDCLSHLEDVLKRCIEKDLVLNWEKCHFMVNQGIVLGHVISKKGIEVDRAKVELIVKLPPPTNVKGIRQFLGHAGFYRRFIKDFPRFPNLFWDDKCQRSFELLKQFLTSTPIVRAPNWELPFEVMCDSSDYAIGAVLGQREDGKPYVIYYARKSLNDAKRNYTTTEKELLVVVYALDKFRAYLIGSSIVVFTDHSALKYLLTKQDAKASEWSSQDKKNFFAKVHAYYWEEPFLFKYCAEQIIRKCVLEQEKHGILSHCHGNACGGHFASQKTTMRVLQSALVALTFKDAHEVSKGCDKCQRLGKISRRNMMPLNPILIVDLFILISIFVPWHGHGASSLASRVGPLIERWSFYTISACLHPSSLCSDMYRTRRSFGSSKAPVPPPVSSPPPKRTRISRPKRSPPEPSITSNIYYLGSSHLVEVLKRPMIAGPPLPGNTDIRDRPFHDEICMEHETLRLLPELEESYRLLQRYHIEPFMTPRGPRYSRPMHFPPIPEDLGSFRHWSQYSEPDMVSTLSGGRVTGRTILRRELPPRMLLIDLVLRTNLFPLQHVVQRRFMAALTYFEEKVHRKRLRRAGTIPLLFPRLISQVLEDMGYPSQPHLERRHHCRELFTSESWTHFLDRSPMDQGIPRPLAPAPPASPAPPDSPAASAPTVQTSPEQDPHTTEPSSSVPAPVTCTTDTPTPPVTPAPAYAESSAGPSITVSATEFRALMSSFHSLSASQATLVHTSGSAYSYSGSAYSYPGPALRHALSDPPSPGHITSSTSGATSMIGYFYLHFVYVFCI